MYATLPVRRLEKILCLLFLVMAGAGCSFAPDYVRPVMDMPAARSTQAAVPVQWWLRYNDSLLNALVREALAFNKDIASAIARVEQAAAMAGISRSDLFPAPSLDGEATQRWESTQSMGGPPPGSERIRNHSVGLRAAWEMDLWGKYRNAVHSAVAHMHETQSDRDAIMLLVAANTVKAYSTLLASRQQAEVSAATVRQREQAVQHFRSTFETGASNEVELTRARGELEQARYNLHMSRMSEELAFNALSLLLGRSPRQIMEEKGLSLPKDHRLTVLERLPADLPVQLLEQRPDIRAAEYALMAAHFDIGVVRAQYLPSLTVSGSVGAAGQDLRQLGLSGASTWMYMGSVNLPLNFWATRFRELMAEARCRELVSAYERAVQQAFGDVRNALVRQQRLADAGKALDSMVNNLARSSSVIRERFREGYASYLEMLDAERALFSARLSVAEHRNARIAAEVDLYMALGGGWTEDGYPVRALAPEAAQAPVP